MKSKGQSKQEEVTGSEFVRRFLRLIGQVEWHDRPREPWQGTVPKPRPLEFWQLMFLKIEGGIQEHEALALLLLRDLWSWSTSEEAKPFMQGISKSGWVPLDGWIPAAVKWVQDHAGEIRRVRAARMAQGHPADLVDQKLMREWGKGTRKLAALGAAVGKSEWQVGRRLDRLGVRPKKRQRPRPK